MEEWAEIEGFPLYSVNDQGQVLNEKRKILVRPRQNAEGFLMVGLYIGSKQTMRAVAPMVADAFLSEPYSTLANSLIHLNGDRSDCRATNLMRRPRWFAIQYHHMFDEPPIRVRVYVPVLNRTYQSLREFCTEYGLIEKRTYVNMLNDEPCAFYGWRVMRV